MELERSTIAFIALCLVLLFSQFFFQESFTGTVGFRSIGCPDASGNKSISNCVFSVLQQCTDPMNPSKRVPCVGQPGDTDYSDASGNRVLCYNADMQPTGLCPSTAYDTRPSVGMGGMGSWNDQAPSTHWSWNSNQASVSQPPSQQGPPVMGGVGGAGSGYDSQFASLRDEIRRTIKSEIANSCSSSNDNDNDSCSEDASPAAMQGAQFLKEVYGQDPNAYIKKDSIPCYGCSLP
jgi:hypothetical protein